MRTIDLALLMYAFLALPSTLVAAVEDGSDAWEEKVSSGTNPGSATRLESIDIDMNRKSNFEDMFTEHGQKVKASTTSILPCHYRLFHCSTHSLPFIGTHRRIEPRGDARRP